MNDSNVIPLIQPPLDTGRPRGRYPLPPRPPRKLAPAQAALVPSTLPTSWSTSASGRPLVVNPNQCMICHKPKHRDTAHHSWEPDTAWPELAALLGWPMPHGDPPHNQGKQS